MTALVLDVSVKPAISIRSRHALNVLEKCGEMMLAADGQYFISTASRSSILMGDIERLAQLGFARIDIVGESTFAVLTRRS